MYKQIRDHEYRIIFFFSDTYFFCRAVLFHDHTVNGKGLSHPLIFLDAAVVMRVKVCKSFVLVERVLLHVDTRGIDVRAEDIHSRRERLLADAEKRKHLVHVHRIYLVPCLQLVSCCQYFFDTAVACRLRHADAQLHTFTLGLAGIEAGFVPFINLVQFSELVAAVCVPDIRLHNKPPSGT